MGSRSAFRFLALFLFAWFTGDRLVAIALDSLLRYSSMPLAKLYSGRGCADVLVLGNSRAFRHFDEVELSRSLGMRVSNLAILGGSMETMGVILEDYIAQCDGPRAVIFEASSMAGDNEHIRGQLVYTRHSDGLYRILRSLAPEVAIATKFSHLFAFNGTTYLNILHKIIRPYHQAPLVGSGTLETAGRSNEPYFKTIAGNDAAFGRMAETLARRDIPLVVIVSPIYSELNATGGDFDQWWAKLKSRAGPTGHAMNYAEFSLPASAFYDPVHLNRTGVKAFLKTLLADGLADHIARGQ